MTDGGHSTTTTMSMDRVRLLPLLVLCCACCVDVTGGAAGSGHQEFVEQPKYTEVNPGESAVLTCRVMALGGLCGWQKDRKPIRMFPGKHEWTSSPETGDCSLRIVNASLAFDDGQWECQVTASAFDKMDALSSEPAQLVVRVAPQDPSLEFNASRLERGQNLTSRADAPCVIRCLSHYGNPPAALKWFLDDVDLSAYASQENATEADKPRTWLAVSLLRYSFRRQDNGRLLRCLAFHHAYGEQQQQKSRETSVRLNVQYPPITRLEGKPDRDLEEQKDSLKLRCSADANPPAYVIWKKNGVEQHLTDKIDFSPLQRTHSGIYMCEAKNAIGQSVTQTVEVDVKYGPKIQSVAPSHVSIGLSNRTTLSCSAEGNPAPSFQWLHSMTGEPEAAHVVGKEAILVLANTTYDHQGKYVCVVSNAINGEQRNTQSRDVTVEVFGPPQVLLRSPSSSSTTSSGSRGPHGPLVTEKGSDAILHVDFCSKPQPSNVTWEWGSFVLPAGEGAAAGKYIARSVKQMKGVKGCFEAELIVQKAESSDSRRYSLNIRNSYGGIVHPIYLKVEEPISMATVIGIVISCLVLLVLGILFVLYAFRTDKWCFKGKDPFSTKKDGHSDVTMDGRSPSISVGGASVGAIPPDALYTIPVHKMDHSNGGGTTTTASDSGRSDDNPSEYASMMMGEHHPHNNAHVQSDDVRSGEVSVVRGGGGGGNDGDRPSEVVYADLDLVHSSRPRGNVNNNGLPGTVPLRFRGPLLHGTCSRDVVPPTEYAQIQVPFRPKPNEQADI